MNKIKLFKRIVLVNEGFGRTLLVCLIILTFQHCGKKDPAPEFIAATVSTFAGGTYGSNDGNGTNAQFYSPWGIAVDASGNVFVADLGNHKIRKITPDGTVSTVAGSTAGYLDGPGVTAKFDKPTDVAVDPSGNVYVTDFLNNKIRKIAVDGTVSTLAGSTEGFANGPGSSARFVDPIDLATDVNANVYVSDNEKIRRILPDGTVSTLAGDIRGFSDGQGPSAKFASLAGLAADANGNIFIADSGNNRIRKMTFNGNVSTLAGAEAGYADGNIAKALFQSPVGIAIDAKGVIYISEAGGTSRTSFHRIRRITPDGTVNTIAGSTVGYIDGNGTEAKFSTPNDVAVDASGNIYVADQSNNVIRKIVIK